jgi:hypothetical protein
MARQLVENPINLGLQYSNLESTRLIGPSTTVALSRLTTRHSISRTAIAMPYAAAYSTRCWSLSTRIAIPLTVALRVLGLAWKTIGWDAATAILRCARANRWKSLELPDLAVVCYRGHRDQFSRIRRDRLQLSKTRLS